MDNLRKHRLATLNHPPEPKWKKHMFYNHFQGEQTVRENWNDVEKWQLLVLWRKFSETAAGQLKLASDEDWLKKAYDLFMGKDREISVA